MRQTRALVPLEEVDLERLDSGVMQETYEYPPWSHGQPARAVAVPSLESPQMRRWRAIGILISVSALTLCLLTGNAVAKTVTNTFTYTGNEQSFGVPTGVTNIRLSSSGEPGAPTARPQPVDSRQRWWAHSE